MEKTMIKATFIRDFTVKDKAENFAKSKGGKVSIKYDYDTMLKRLIMVYRVKY